MAEAVPVPTTDAMTKPPRLGGVARALSDVCKHMFERANPSYPMVALHRAGLAFWPHGPGSDWQLLADHDRSALGAGHPGAKTPPPERSGVAKSVAEASHSAYRLANRYLMVPLHRAGLAAWTGSPVAGWQCLLTTRGRRSGLPREAPLDYIVRDGAAWVLAGYGPRTQWYRNVLADPRVRLRLPARGSIEAMAEEVEDPDVRARVIPPLARSMALPGLALGCFPPLSSDERILRGASFVPLVRLTPADGCRIEAGPDDPGGYGWVWRQSLALGLTVLVGSAICSVLRRR